MTDLGARVPGGDAFTDAQRQDINRALDEAHRVSGWVFAVEVGATDGPSRAHAEALHRSLPEPARSVLVSIDPEHRTLEIVTGSSVGRVLDNRSVALAALTMQSAFAGGDLTRGLVAGLQQIAHLARQPKSLHLDTP
jgi:Domain of unknown function (DUF5130)